jgi:hypothetical protein
MPVWAIDLTFEEKMLCETVYKWAEHYIGTHPGRDRCRRQAPG